MIPEGEIRIYNSKVLKTEPLLAKDTAGQRPKDRERTVKKLTEEKTAKAEVELAEQRKREAKVLELEGMKEALDVVYHGSEENISQLIAQPHPAMPGFKGAYVSTKDVATGYGEKLYELKYTKKPKLFDLGVGNVEVKLEDIASLDLREPLSGQVSNFEGMTSSAKKELVRLIKKAGTTKLTQKFLMEEGYHGLKTDYETFLFDPQSFLSSPERTSPRGKAEREAVQDKVAKETQPATEPDQVPVAPEVITAEPVKGVPEKDFGRAVTPLVVDNPQGTAEQKPSGLALGVQEKAMRAGLLSKLVDLPQYDVVHFKDSVDKILGLMRSDYPRAVRIAMGQEIAPQGIIPELVFDAVERRAIAERDIALITDLGTKSILLQEATTMGQRISALQMRTQDSPVDAVKEISKERKEATEAQLKKKKKTLEKAKEETVAEIEKEIQKSESSVKDWGDFLDSIKC